MLFSIVSFPQWLQKGFLVFILFYLTKLHVLILFSCLFCSFPLFFLKDPVSSNNLGKKIWMDVLF